MKRIAITVSCFLALAAAIAASNSNTLSSKGNKSQQSTVLASPTPDSKQRVLKATVFHNASGETVYLINGNESWRRTEIQVKRAQKIEISATGIVRWAPDGIEKIDVTPDGTRPPYRDGWNYKHFPYPEAGIGSLVMRIGKGIYAVGSGGVVESEDQGFIEFMVNDDVLDDNSGFFSVKVRVQPLEGGDRPKY